MTPAEKARLYTAIGYSETAVNHNLPKDVSDPSPPRPPIGTGAHLDSSLTDACLLLQGYSA